MDTQARTTAKGQVDEWTADDVVRSIRSDDWSTHHARRWAVALGALAIAAVATATVGMSAVRPIATPKPVALPARIAAAAAGGPAAPRVAPALAARSGPASRSRSIVIVMPADRDYLATTSIPVAGLALGRPHGPRIRTVRVELYVGGHRVDGLDLDVYAGRFAGVLTLDDPIDAGAAEIRLTNPANPAQAAAARSITLVTPSTSR